MPTENIVVPFQREERYVVLKLNRLAEEEAKHWRECQSSAKVDCVVVEHDWPEYEPVWRMIERRVVGLPNVSASEELVSVLHWRGKHAEAIRERDQLQRDLTAADEKSDTLSTAYLRAGEREHELRLRVHHLKGLLRKARRYVKDAWPDGVHSYRNNSISGDLLGDIDAELKQDIAPAPNKPCTYPNGITCSGDGTGKACNKCPMQGWIPPCTQRNSP